MVYRTSAFAATLAALSTASAQGYGPQKPLVDSKSLQDLINTDNLFAHANKLQEIAYATEGRNRVTGSKGHEDTVEYIIQQLTDPALGGFYDVQKQFWNASVMESGTAELLINDATIVSTLAEFSASTEGTAEAPLAVVNNLGCDVADFPETVSGNIALIERGTCPFSQKAANAKTAGAIGALIFNNVDGNFTGITLGSDNLGETAPTVGVTRADGLSFKEKIAAGETVTAKLTINTVIKTSITANVLAQSTTGNAEEVVVLGAHADSVAAGPGINDDGSGTIGILEVAKRLAGFKINNAVRFGFWSGEEQGLLGSTFYVGSLSEAEKAKINLYLNFDMIASPNYFYGIFDGDGDAFNLTGPPGSSSIEKLFQDHFTANNLPWNATEFSGRSDYGPFIDVGIPAGGLFTGAEALKSEREAELFGGEAGVAFDINYHLVGDTVDNLNAEAWLVNTKAIAHSAATYALSFDSLDLGNSTVSGLKRRLNLPRAPSLKKALHTHGKHSTSLCGQSSDESLYYL